MKRSPISIPSEIAVAQLANSTYTYVDLKKESRQSSRVAGVVHREWRVYSRYLLDGNQRHVALATMANGACIAADPRVLDRDDVAQYNPIERPAVATEFAKLWQQTPEAILRFVHQWGIPSCANHPFHHYDTYDEVPEIRRESELVFRALSMIKALDESDWDALASHIKPLLSVGIDVRALARTAPDLDPDYGNALVDTRVWQAHCGLRAILDTHLSALRLGMDFASEKARYRETERVGRQATRTVVKERVGTHVARRVVFESLLDAIYYHVSDQYAANTELASCVRCGSLFFPERRDTRYCPTWGYRDVKDAKGRVTRQHFRRKDSTCAIADRQEEHRRAQQLGLSTSTT